MTNMAASVGGVGSLPCDDFLEFQEALKNMRMIDDRIVHALNTSIPTQSFADRVNAAEQCEHLYKELLQSYNQREVAIKRCIKVVSDKVNYLKNHRQNSDNFEALKELRQEQNKLRMFQSEINVDEVVKDRSLKIFQERCRTVYKPPLKTL